MKLKMPKFLSFRFKREAKKEPVQDPNLQVEQNLKRWRQWLRVQPGGDS